jgi:hypothetical protein
MGALMITCPNTGQPIPTAIDTDEHSLRKIPDVLTRTRCPCCGLDHAWWTREAWLANAPPEGSLPGHLASKPPLRSDLIHER